MNNNDAPRINEIMFNLTSKKQSETNKQFILNTKVIERI